MPTGSPPTRQIDWDLHNVEHGSHPVSRVTTDVRWPALALTHANIVQLSLLNDGTVVDIGGGDGGLGYLLGAECKCYINLEPSTVILSRLESQGATGTVRGFGEHLPFRPEAFTCVSAKSSLDHAFDLDLMLAESYRVLLPTGSIVVSLVNEDSWYKRLLPRMVRRRQMQCTDHNFFLGVSDLTNSLVSHGFVDIEATTYDYLRLPIRIENLAYRLTSARIVKRLLLACDTVCRSIFPASGGTMIVHAKKPQL